MGEDISDLKDIENLICSMAKNQNLIQGRFLSGRECSGQFGFERQPNSSSGEYKKILRVPFYKLLRIFYGQKM